MKHKELLKWATEALREDAAAADITTRLLIPANDVSSATIIIKENAVLCGLEIAKQVFQKLDRKVRFQTSYKDGAKVKRDTKVVTIKGKTRALLTGERAALNFIGHLSGIATITWQFVQKTKGTKAKILDTRKTTPGIRVLEKYAVRCGGGLNHRSDLSQLVLIKDNHREACAPQLNIPQAIHRIRKKTRKKIEIEVDTLGQYQQALSAKPDMILLDNMLPSQIRKAVVALRAIPQNQRPELEASGGITLANIAAVAKTGVNRISVGALTHTHKAINVTMELTSS